MQSLNSLKSKVFQINTQNFEKTALEIFRFQYIRNPVYKSYVDHLKISPDDVNSSRKIPFLPIRFFKSQKIQISNCKSEAVFLSSGTTGTRSRHFIEDLGFYKKVSSIIFELFYGEIEGEMFIGLLPSYLERGDSSLVYMVNHFIERSGKKDSGFYLNNIDELIYKLETLRSMSWKVYLFGVTFALLDLTEKYSSNSGNLVIIETGGMKGRGKEMIRAELHEKLKKSFPQSKICSEYGMTELLSQAYMTEGGLFQTPPWMKVLIRDIYDPFDYLCYGKSGAINIIDLANVHSCSFIETEDLGIANENGFQVLGRLDNSDLRGCNLLFS